MTDILKQELTCDLVTVIKTIKSTPNFVHFILTSPFPREFFKRELLHLGQ